MGLSPEENVRPYLQETANRFVALYDVYRQERLGRTQLAFVAVHRRRDEKYLITRTARIWGVENRLHVFVTAPDAPVSVGFLRVFGEDIRKAVPEFLKAHPEHMSSIFLGVSVTGREASEEAVAHVSRFRRLKFLKFGLHGWIEVYLALVDLQGERVHVHPKGRPFVKAFEYFDLEKGVSA